MGTNVNPIQAIFTEKYSHLVALSGARLTLLIPYLWFLLLVVIVGGYEGNDWRRQRLYAGYYRLILATATILFVGMLVALGAWLIMPSLMQPHITAIGLAVIGFALGWTAMAGRPVMR